MKKLMPKQIRKITFLILFIGAIIAFLGISLNENVILIIMGLIAMIASIVFHFVFYRCPHCGKFLDRSTGDYCPYCSKNVNEQ